jgi:diguanylate cyclase (GGDEF)-like protein
VSERRSLQRGRTLLGGKIVFNNGGSVIDCTVRNLSEEGACVEVASPIGLPDHVHLLIAGDAEPRPCNLIWQSGNRIGLSFSTRDGSARAEDPGTQPVHQERGGDLLRDEMLALRASLDEVRFGVVLLDAELRAQFVNRAFRKMWRLPDVKADSKPAFVALLYHGCNTRAYKIPADGLDAFIAERVASVKAGDPTPLDIRLSNGEVIRTQCAVLPNGGRMLSYTYVTDIVRHADALEVLRAALDRVPEGIILLDSNYNAQFMNRAVRQLWKVSDDQAEGRPPYSQLVGDARHTGTYGVAPDELEAFIARRIALMRAGDPTPHDLRTSDGRHIRSQCAILPGGGRMLTYWDITDLVRNAEQLEKLASIDSLTGVYNRRHFLKLAEAEWSRFQRYLRPLSMLMVDIDHFKSVNDRYGHATGDMAISWIANACQEDQRGSDIVGRIGGEEFALLLPETDLTQASIVAERIRKKVESHSMTAPNETFAVAVSIGVASAALSMSGVGALMSASDQALYEAKSQGRNRVVEFAPRRLAELELAAE